MSTSNKRDNSELNSPGKVDIPNKRLITSPEVTAGAISMEASKPTLQVMDLTEDDIRKELGSNASEDTIKLAVFMQKLQNSTLCGFKQNLEYSQDKMAAMEDNQARLLTLLTGMQKQIDVLKMENGKMKSEIDEQQNHSRRNNLIIRGIPEGNYQNVELIVREFFAEMLNAHDIPIERVHRLGKYFPNRTRPIIIKFSFFKDREMIWDCRDRLKYSKFFLDEDFSPAVQAIRRKLYPVLAEAKRRRHKGQLVKDKVRIDGIMYGLEDLHRLPKEVRDGSRWSEKQVAFFGELCPASNFHPAVFTHNGIRFENSEKMLFYKKAKLFDDDETANKILKESDPRAIKTMSRQIKNVNDVEWRKQIKLLVTPGLIDKFDQNPHLLNWLESTDNRMLVEAAGPHDKVWGNGLPLSAKNLHDLSAWTGENQQGEMLSEVRKVLLPHMAMKATRKEKKTEEERMQDDARDPPTSQIQGTQPFGTHENADAEYY